MKHLLLAKGLWGSVEGSEVFTSDATTTSQTLYRWRLQKAFSTIVLAIDSARFYLITSSEEPKQAWDALRKHFERETLANKLFLKKNNFIYNLSGSLSKIDKVVLGDLNTDLLVERRNASSPQKRLLKGITELHDRNQVIESPTRVMEHSECPIDLCFTNAQQTITESNVIDHGLSDHSLVYCVMKSAR